MKGIALAAAALACCAFAQGAAKAVIADDVQPEWAEWLEKHRIPQHVEEWAPKVSKLICGSEKPVHDATYVLHVVPDEKVTKDTPIAFAGGGHISVTAPWVREREKSGCMDDVMGAYVHELTHAVQGTVGDYWGRQIDLGNTIAVFPPKNGGRPVRESLTEGLADWTRRFFYASPEEQERRRFDLLNKDLAITDFGQGPDFLDYLNRRFGPTIVPRILRYCSKNGGDKIRKMWPALTDRTYPQLLADWRGEERIDDPVLRWSYIGGSGGPRRPDGNDSARGHRLASGSHFHSWGGWRFEETGDGVGGRLRAQGAGGLKYDLLSGDWTLAMRARIATDRSRKGARAIFAVGNFEREGEKELVFAASGGRGLSAVMVVNDGGQQVAASRKLVESSTLSAGYFTLVASVEGGTNMTVRVNGAPAGSVGLTQKCRGAKFGPGVQVGGMHGQIYAGSRLADSGMCGVQEGDDVRFADLRLFRRRLSDSETAKYEGQF